ncbi:MAG: hypothetical protein JKY67_23140 [Pseudomonadales bacterium]|nr:hypothetical protein [Pseudomonadales bacterium]PCJ62262.1 MAG: hypothetical protein COA79_04155 [Planctomycetota bacterium]
MSNNTFSKVGSIIFRPDDMPAPGPYYTTLIDMKNIETFPFDYAMYFSTDHNSKDGGIWLYVCNGVPSEAKSWKSYDDVLGEGAFDHIAIKPLSNPIYFDNVQGDGHTETPHANVVDGKVFLSYHKNGIGPSQATLLATSDDGISFSRINGDEDSVILKYNPDEDPGDGHTGYFRWSKNPFSGIENKYIGYSLHGGGNDYYSALWGSDDAINWKRLHVLEPIEGQSVEEDRMIIWHELDPNSIRVLDDGGYAAICGVGNRASGGMARFVELYEIYLADDGVTLTHQSKNVLARGSMDDNDSEELASPSSILIDEKYHLVYVGAKDGGTSNTVMSAIGTINMDSKNRVELNHTDQKKHIYGNS